MPEEATSHWFLKDKKGVHGPFTEPEMRRYVRNSEDQDLEIRQGSSDWCSANVIRKKILELARDGVYIQFKGTAEGPFTVGRAYEVLVPLGTDGIVVKTGANGKWVSADAWLSKVDELRARKSGTKKAIRAALSDAAERQSGNSQRERSGAPSKTSNQRVASTGADREIDKLRDQNSIQRDAELTEAIPVAEAIPVTDDIPVVEAIPIPDEIPEVVAYASQPRPRRKAATPTQPDANHSFNQASDPDRRPEQRPIVPNIHRRPLQTPRRPVNRTMSASSSTWVKAAASITSVVAILGVVGFFASGPILNWINEPSEEVTASSDFQEYIGQQDTSDQSLVSASGLSGGATNDPADVPYQGSSTPQSLESSDPAGGASASAVSTAGDAPPIRVDDGMLFRPRFGTSSGEIDAGTAFAAKMVDRDETLVLSALHLFGPAGGLSRDIPADELAANWNRLVLEDCKSQSYIGDVPMSVLSFPDSKPLPESSPQGDVVACRAKSGEGLNPLLLSRRTPTAGQRVWLVSKVIGSRSLVHPATVEGIQDGWLVYTYDSPRIELRATSGAPVVDQSGHVVAVNAGGGEDGGKTLGVGTPVSKFYAAIETQL